MANREHLKILLQGVDIWNQWRKEHPEINPDLTNAKITGKRIRPPNPEKLQDGSQTNTPAMGFFSFSSGTFLTDLSRANLRATFLQCSQLADVIFNDADLCGANLRESDLTNAAFKKANLRLTNLERTKLTNADFSDANLAESFLSGASFHGTRLDGADLTNAKIGWATFTDVDLSKAKHLDTVKHSAPSEIGVNSLYKSGGNISESFLRGCGVPDEFITYLPAIIGAEQAVKFYSCFISFSFNDLEFCKRLYSRLRDSHVRVWFAPDDVKGGQKLYEQIDEAIRYYDKLLLVLSEHSMRSEWVTTEIRKARRAEVKEKRRKLFPLRLVDFETIQDWGCFDADTGKDLAVEVREYFIPDFSNWKDHDAFEAAFDRLLRDLKG